MITKLPRLAIKIIFIIITCLVLVLFLPALLSFWVSPQEFWVIGFLTLIFPYTATILALLCIFWFISKPKFGWFILIVFLLGYKHYCAIFSFTSIKDFMLNKQTKDIRIISWNIQSFNGISKTKEAKKNSKNDILNCINKYKPNIVCLQEFNTSNLSADADNLSTFKKYYPYYYFSEDYKRKKGSYISGCIIFSTYPIIKTGKTKYPFAESLIYADIKINSDTIRVYTSHLQSYKFKKEDYDELDNISQHNEASKTASKNLFNKMKLAFKHRAEQATIVKDVTSADNKPSIICGDFNDVPASYTYNTIKGNRQDAFLNNIFGIGKTFTSLAPTLRIDYILPDNYFKINQFDLVDENLSDHLMLVTDVMLHNNKSH
ncbi:MAG TPA: endonuclease/exonuclease/phosphatase family protein [Chitinophagaceae bacterium]|nr:endonuclease/exonuclease/phosphatase family protein [Chitinophagaceae bacterium]